MTLAEFQELPEMEQRCGLPDGALYMITFPVPDRQIVPTMMTTRLALEIVETGPGIVMQ